jgi:hypothetical protein
MTTNIEREYHAQDAINQFVQYSCAFLVPGEEGRIAADDGSGTIIRTKGDHCCILTAKHIAEDARDKQYRLGFLGCSNPIPDFVAGILLFPDDADVALLIVKDELRPALTSLTLTQDSIPTKGQQGITDEDSFVLIGYPAQMSRYYEDKSQQGFVSVTYWCPPADISSDKNGRYQLEWKDAAVWRGDRTFDLPAPKGMSGDPLWRFRKPASSSIWSAGEIGRIVAIQAAWDKKDVLFLEPVGKWGAWFHESFTTIDKALAR